MNAYSIKWSFIILLCKTSICLAQLVPQNSLPKVSIIKSEFIFEKAPFLQCHASTLIELENGKIMASWFGGTHERNNDVSIYVSVTDKVTWTRPKLTSDGVENDTLRYPTWNPVLFKNSIGTIFLFYKVGRSPSTWWGMYKTSTNEGLSWSNKTRLPDGILGPIKNKAIQLEDGRIISPSSIETNKGAIWKSHIEISEDNGYTWRKTLIPSDEDIKLIQPSLIRLPGGDLKAILRSNQNVLMESISKDNGESWSKAVPSSLKNPNSGADALTLANGDFLIVYNPTLSGNDWSDGRHKLNLAYSTDGTNWTPILRLEDENEGEFSYPAIIQDKKGAIHISYTYNREKIKYVKLRLRY